MSEPSEEKTRKIHLDDLMYDKNAVNLTEMVKGCIEVKGDFYCIPKDFVWYCSTNAYCPHKKESKEKLSYCGLRVNKW
jgi:hypothetical protein